MKKYLFLMAYLILSGTISEAQLLFSNRSEDFLLHHVYGTTMMRFGSGVSFFDFDGDGTDDLSFTSGKGDSLQFYRSTGAGFQNLGGLGITETDESKQILWVDYDNDGDHDLFVTNYMGQSRLWKNNGDLTFENITRKAGILSEYMPTFGSAWADFDRDGYLDLYLTNYSSPGHPPAAQRSYLYHNLGDGTFKEIALDQGVILTGNYYFAPAFLDLNRSGWPDLFIIQDFAIGNSAASGNVLFWNNQGKFQDAQNSGSLEEIRMSAMSIAAGDYDKSGTLDIYITNTANSYSKFHVNRGDSTFVELADQAGVTFNDKGAGWGAQFFDFDNDTWEDLGVVGAVPTQYTPLQADKLYRNLGNNHFEHLKETSIDFSDSARSFAVAYGDYNNDGLLDFSIATADIDSVLFYENINSNNNHFFTCQLTGTASNKDGIGAWIEIYANGEKQVRYTTCGLGFLSQNTSKVHFGLGLATQIDSIEVKWPSGWVDRYYDIPADQFMEITEGETADFRFNLTQSGDQITEEISEITLRAPDYMSYLWNNDDTTSSLTVTKWGVYVCSVINEIGERGFSYPVTIRQILPEIVTPVSLSHSPSSSLVVKPNPSPGYFRIFSEEALKTAVYTVTGKLVWEGEEPFFDLSNHPSGIYIIKAIGQTSGAITVKVVKQ